MSKPKEIHPIIGKLLHQKLTKYVNTKLNLATCVEIYNTIFNTLVEVIEKCNVPLTNEGMNYLAQQYYDGIRINNSEELDPDIFTKRATIENIDTLELTLLATLLNGTDFAVPLLNEIKRRS